ncbi:hypothetical protein KAW18_14295 [candidate division WOR-3 bacterium]|nr:hypothetical protein [candidate division WOR-3 bacterium]
MKIENIVENPYEKSIIPGLSFEIKISHIKYQEAITGVSGWLQTDDGKIVAEIKETIRENPAPDEVGARDSDFDSQFKEEIYKTTLITLLDKRALDHIEKRRKVDRKGDVKLTLNLDVKSIESRATISHLHEVKPKSIGLSPIRVPTHKRETEGEIIVYAYDSKFSSSRANRWILSGNGNPIFLSIKEQLIKAERTISSSDWIHDYAPKLELGEYFIVEIPKGKKIIEEAWQYIEKAEECFRRWDTKGAYANCREAGSLLDRTLKTKMGKDSFIYKERWGRTYGRFNNFASLDLHLEDIKESPGYSPDDVKINKTDAEHTLIVTKMLVKYAEELIEEGK